ncbi:MAG: hypothetical protein HC923_03405 [Myxococcales bacterium]|nr:hypothetical protein [Myxococcales bacterium]
MNPRPLLVTPFFVVGALAFTTPPAQAGLMLGLDVGPNFVLNAPDSGEQDLDLDQDAGIGIAARLGYQLDLKILKLIPEAKFGFEDPGAPDAFRIMGGLRVRLLEGFSPVAFAHLGGLVGDLEGFAWDVGGGIDFTLIPHLALGAFVSYNRAENRPLNLDNFEGPDAWEWLQVGAAVTFTL